MLMKRMTYIIGFGLVAILGLSTILPLLSTNVTTPIQQAPVEPTALPTFPPPPDPSTITFDETYLHPSGLFTVAEPNGWSPSQPLTTQEQVRAVFSNTQQQGVIQVDVDRPASAGEAALTLDDVDARFNDSWLSASWREYTSWEESSREREDDRLVIDFALGLRGQTYVARQTAWTDGDWIYSVRVVMPENATNSLLYILDNVANSLEPNKEFAGTPFNWNAYFDPQATHVIRYPAEWDLADSAPGRPASIQGNGSAVLRVEAQSDTQISSEEEARTWAEQLRSNVSVLSVEPVSRDDSEGYSVAYSYRTVDGDAQSGLALLLNGPEDQLHVANLRFTGNEVDLNAAEVDEQYSSLLDVLDTFTIMPELAGVETS